METYREPEEEDEERRRQRKLEEALEVKSLRRIISAYLKYAILLALLSPVPYLIDKLIRWS